MIATEKQTLELIDYCADPPALTDRSKDFNYILRQFDAELFQSVDSPHQVLIFKPEQLLPLGKDQQNVEFEIAQIVFLVTGENASQLYFPYRADLSTQYFKESTIPLHGKHSTTIERDFDRCILQISENLAEQFECRQIENHQKIHADYLFKPIPPRLHTLLHSEETGYICITSERIGAYPKMKPFGMSTVHFRGFVGSSVSLREIEVTSAVRCGGGLGNWRFETSIGEIFAPGGGSLGDPTLACINGDIITLSEIEIGDQG